MISNPLSLIDSACNAAQMAAFCIPEGGQVAAAGIASLQAILDITMGGEDHRARADCTISKDDLATGIDEIKKLIVDAKLKADIDSYDTHIATLQDDFNTAFAQAVAGKGFGLSKRYVDVENNQEWQAYYAALTDPIYKAGPLEDMITALSRKTDTATQLQTAVLLSAAVGMFSNYAQLAMVVEWTKLQNAYQDDYDKYAAAKKAYDAAKHHHGEKAPTPPAAPPATFMGLIDLPPPEKLDAKLAGAIPVLDARVKVLEAFHAAMASEPAARMAQVQVQPSGGGFVFVDAATGFTSILYGTRMQADMACQIHQGQVQAEAEAAVRARYPGVCDDADVPHVSADDTANLRQIVKDWQTCRDKFAALVKAAAGKS